MRPTFRRMRRCLRREDGGAGVALDEGEGRREAIAVLRMLFGKIMLTPGPVRGAIFATLHGALGIIPDWTERQALGKTLQTRKTRR